MGNVIGMVTLKALRALHGFNAQQEIRRSGGQGVALGQQSGDKTGKIAATSHDYHVGQTRMQRQPSKVAPVGC